MSLTKDAEFIYRIKQKMEIVLSFLIKHYNISDFVSPKFRFRIDYNKIMKSDCYKLYEEEKDISGQKLEKGTDYIPISFTEWLQRNLPDYVDASLIYDTICETGFISQSDLSIFNLIYKKYSNLIENNKPA